MLSLTKEKTKEKRKKMNTHIAKKFYKVTLTTNKEFFNKSQIYFAESAEILAETLAKVTRALNKNDIHIYKYKIENATEKEIMLYIIDYLEYEEQVKMIDRLYR